MQETCSTVAQLATTNIWLNALALASAVITPIGAAFALWLKAKAKFQEQQTEFNYSKHRQYETLDKVEEVKKGVDGIGH